MGQSREVQVGAELGSELISALEDLRDMADQLRRFIGDEEDERQLALIIKDIEARLAELREGCGG